MGQRHRPAVVQPRGSRRPRAEGFTLIELAVTLLVLALALAVVMPAVGRSTQAIQTRAEVARFSAMIRHARERAITSREAHTVQVQPPEHRVLIVAGEDQVRVSRALPAHLVVEAVPPQPLALRFEPNGVSTGGEFFLTAGAIRYRVTVDALTGRVKAVRL